MEFGSNKRPKKRKQVDPKYPTRLQMYKVPPVQSIRLQEFQELALQRLKLLQEIERIRQRSAHEGENREKQLKEYYQPKMTNAIKAYMPLSAVDDRGFQTIHVEERQRDHISHYILRLAYCRTEDMRRWFLSQETELLRFRFLHIMNPGDIKDFFDHYEEDFSFKSVVIPLVEFADEKMLQLASEVYNFYGTPKPSDDGKPVLHKCYKVPFTAALDLIQSRQVVVKEGYVYVPDTKNEMIVSLVCNKFRARVSEELVKTLHHLSVVDDDERIAPLLKSLKNRYLGEDFTDAGTQLAGGIQLQQIETLSKESFPPCMCHLHESLKAEHHLKHFGRLQYGLFLKSIGMTLEQAMTFWRSEFIKKMEPDKFDKQYAYNVRHSYGKEGKRANYTAYSCMKIILSNAPGQGDHHGCPFRHWDEAHVRHMLSSHGLSQKNAGQVLDYVRKSHHQLACQKYFEVIHGLTTAPFSLEHPTQFFLESRKARGGLPAAKQEEAANQQAATAPPVEGNEFGDISVADLEGLDDDMDTS